MAKNTTPSDSNTPRRDFLKQTAGIAGAMLLGGSSSHGQNASSGVVLTSAELKDAAQTLSEMGGSTDLALVIMEHIESLARQGHIQRVVHAVSVVRQHVAGNDDTRARALTDEARARIRQYLAQPEN